jgi:hypothetical protein
LLALAAVAIVGCGSGERQDADEPEGNFKVDVVNASFPQKQKLAKTSELVITVRNAGGRAIPNIAVTVHGFDFREKDQTLADPTRPRFVINGRKENIGGLPESKDAAPAGCETAYVDTWACGELAPGREHTFRWSVTAVKAGHYELEYEVSAGLNGKAKAVDASGSPVKGLFAGDVSDAAPNVRVADDGKTIVEGRP